jgi:hypothetical protein
MNSQASRAMENGLTPQLMNRVTPTPFQCRRTSLSEWKSIFSSIGRIISQINTATGRLTLATSRLPRVSKRPGVKRPSTIPARMHRATHRLR